MKRGVGLAAESEAGASGRSLPARLCPLPAGMPAAMPDEVAHLLYWLAALLIVVISAALGMLLGYVLFPVPP